MWFLTFAFSVIFWCSADSQGGESHCVNLRNEKNWVKCMSCTVKFFMLMEKKKFAKFTSWAQVLGPWGSPFDHAICLSMPDSVSWGTGHFCSASMEQSTAINEIKCLLVLWGSRKKLLGIPWSHYAEWDTRDQDKWDAHTKHSNKHSQLDNVSTVKWGATMMLHAF